MFTASFFPKLLGSSKRFHLEKNVTITQHRSSHPELPYNRKRYDPEFPVSESRDCFFSTFFLKHLKNISGWETIGVHPALSAH